MEIRLSIEEGSGSAEQKSVEVEDEVTVKAVLEAADINPETVLVENEGRIVPAGEEVPGRELRVIQVISGG